MRLLLDECVPQRLARHFAPHEVKSLTQIGWMGIKNSQLLALASKEFDILITMDRNMSFQQSLPQFEIGLVVLCAKSNRLQDLLPLVPEILAVLPASKPGTLTLVGA